MTPGNGMPAASDCDEGMDWAAKAQSKQGGDDSQPLRVIQNLIARLEVVNRQLSVSRRTRPVPWQEETGIPEPDAPTGLSPSP